MSASAADQPLGSPPVVPAPPRRAEPHGPTADVAERFRVATSPENEGESFVRNDYLVLLAACLLVPALFIALAWLA
jgi:hypothetical protein